MTRTGSSGATAIPRACYLDGPTGLALGDFNGAGPFGIYHPNVGVAGNWEIRRETPEIVGERCSWDAGIAVHTTFSGANAELELDDVVFDPFSPTLF